MSRRHDVRPGELGAVLSGAAGVCLLVVAAVVLAFGVIAEPHPETRPVVEEQSIPSPDLADIKDSHTLLLCEGVLAAAGHGEFYSWEIEECQKWAASQLLVPNATVSPGEG